MDAGDADAARLRIGAVYDSKENAVAVARRQGVTWIDLYPLFVDEHGKLKAEYTNDGLHLLGPAYLIWRDAIKPYV